MTDPTVPGAGGDPGVPVPRAVDLARWLWIAGSVLVFVRSLVELSDRTALVAELRKLAPQLSQEQVDSETNFGILLTIVSSLAILAVYLVIAIRMTQGRQWARVAMAVLGSLRVLRMALMVLAVFVAYMWLAVFLPVPASDNQVVGSNASIAVVDVVFGAVVLVMDLTTLVLLFLPKSNRFFRETVQLYRARTNSSASGGH